MAVWFDVPTFATKMTRGLLFPSIGRCFAFAVVLPIAAIVIILVLVVGAVRLFTFVVVVVTWVGLSEHA